MNKPSPTPLKAVILAAGVGSRIRPLTNDCPKSLLSVAGKPILERMISNCNSCGISEFILILGYLDHRIRDFVATVFPKIDVTYVVNEKYAETNTGYSLMLAAEAIGGTGFIKFDADVVFDNKILHRLIRSPFEVTLCIDRGIELDAEEVKIIVDDQFRVLRASKDVEPKEALGESIGIEKINADTAKHLFAELAQMMTQADHHQAYYEVAYERLIAKGFTFHALDITGLNWTEIDTHCDFVSANKMFAIPPRARAPKHQHLLNTASIRGFRRV